MVKLGTTDVAQALVPAVPRLVSALGSRTGRRPALLLLCVFSALCCAAPPQRIVSTAPSATEMLYALGLGDRVVGVTTYCHYPPEATRKPKIGTYLYPNVETIVSLRPDLVVSEVAGVRRSERLSSLHLNVLEYNDATLAGIYDAIHRIGAAAGVPQRADALCARMRASLNAIRARVASLPRRRVLFLIGRTPGRLEDMIAVGRASYLNELTEIAGGENVFRDSPAAYAKIPLEELLARNPSVIVDMGEMSETAHLTEAQQRAVVELWNRYPALAAVREHRVYPVDSDIFVVPGPRVVEAARALAHMLHPEAGL
jgi:iron complex transport system substrate-binding protein